MFTRSGVGVVHCLVVARAVSEYSQSNMIMEVVCLSISTFQWVGVGPGTLVSRFTMEQVVSESGHGSSLRVI